MMIKVFTISYQSTIDGFDDEDLRRFMRDKVIVDCSEYFYQKDGVPRITFVLRYSGDVSCSKERAPAKAHPKKIDESWKDLLSDKDLKIFAALREWRSAQARSEGVPPYIIFTNHQLAIIASRSPQSKSQLSQIEGVGPKKIEKYGADLISMTKAQETDA